ncbi:hypothetical protein [Glaciecola sp. KUL10]|uniref:hypothetical protein n=1 Tax=Glaciecola sp. (strain KUL10) TaxID=2161813 RepID=UPI0011B4C575|nr:hypothetical protein [Glaciecola sp. KUL10]
MDIKARISFLKIPRPPYGYRYFGKSCWMRMDSEKFSDLACCVGFADGQEYYDGDSAESTLSFYKDEPLIHEINTGMNFSLRILDLQVATGQILSVKG